MRATALEVFALEMLKACIRHCDPRRGSERLRIVDYDVTINPGDAVSFHIKIRIAGRSPMQANCSIVCFDESRRYGTCSMGHGNSPPEIFTCEERDGEMCLYPHQGPGSEHRGISEVEVGRLYDALTPDVANLWDVWIEGGLKYRIWRRNWITPRQEVLPLEGIEAVISAITEYEKNVREEFK